MLMSLTLLYGASAHCEEVQASPRHRIIISTDIGGTDPDDNQSMIHLLMYANEFDIEGLISSPSFGDGSKDEILRMIDLYAADRPMLVKGLADSLGHTRGEFPTPEYLKSITKQGRLESVPLCGFGEPTEGSEWIVSTARKDDERPLWVLVWGAPDDLAQALHDAPDIASRIRVYWIGGPNKKWGSNAYSYIAKNFPGLWFIENNASYRGFIANGSSTPRYGKDFWKTFMAGAGVMGDDFINYYGGLPKMGDTPSLLYLMTGDAVDPTREHWGGRFEPVDVVPRYRVSGKLCERDTVACYALMEWVLEGPVLTATPDSACFTLTVDRQRWPGYYIGDGKYMVKYSPKAPAVLDYTISSYIPGFPSHEGRFVVGAHWPAVGAYQCESACIEAVPIKVARPDGPSTWFTDIQDYSSAWQGVGTTSCWRDDVMSDWARRFKWLRRVD